MGMREWISNLWNRGAFKTLKLKAITDKKDITHTIKLDEGSFAVLTRAIANVKRIYSDKEFLKGLERKEEIIIEGIFSGLHRIKSKLRASVEKIDLGIKAARAADMHRRRADRYRKYKQKGAAKVQQKLADKFSDSAAVLSIEATDSLSVGMLTGFEKKLAAYESLITHIESRIEDIKRADEEKVNEIGALVTGLIGLITSIRGEYKGLFGKR